MFRLYRAMAAARAEVFVLRSTRLLAGPCHLFARRFGGRFIFMIANASNCDPMAREGAPPPFNRWYRRAIRGADAVAAQTRDQQRQMRERFGIETYLVPNGIDLDGLAPSGDPPEWDVLWVGSLKPQKQPDVLIRIAAFCPQLRFGVIGGPGGDRLYYEEAVAALQQQPNCEYLGFIPPDRIGRYYHRARILLNTSIGRGRVSLHEGFPNTYLFAWAQGVPTCSLHVDPDGVIAEQGLGFVESDVESLSARLVSFVTDEDGYEAARRRCRAHVAEHHSLQATLDAFAGLLGVLP
jgi:glycosyltransferase involved in cell wall biosynthesis